MPAAPPRPTPLPAPAPPTAGPVACTCPRFETLAGAGGVPVAAGSTAPIPLVNLLCGLPAGGGSDPRGLEGLGALLPQVMREGSRSRTAEELRAAMSERGADLATWTDREGAYLAIEAMEDDLEPMLELLLELVFRPELPEAALEAARQRQIAKARARRWRPAVMADRQLARLLFGEDGRARPVEGSEESLRQIRRHDLTHHHRCCLRAGGPAFALAGRAGVSDLLAKIAERLPGTGSPPAPESDAPSLAEPARERLRVQVVGHPRTTLAELRVAQAVPGRRHADFPALDLLADVLSRRLMVDLRTLRGSTYGVRARLSGDADCGVLAVATAVPYDRAAEAVKVVLSEMECLRRQAIPDTELEAAKNRFAGCFLRSVQSGRLLVIRLQRWLRDGLEPADVDRQLRGVRSLTPRDLLRSARRHLHPRRSAVVAVGDEGRLQRVLTRIEMPAGAGP
ncbi:MAG: insulinase family protein [Holophagales bacterium]|nr:insulinase family protein [Holophagales bacterium]